MAFEIWKNENWIVAEKKGLVGRRRDMQRKQIVNSALIIIIY